MIANVALLLLSFAVVGCGGAGGMTGPAMPSPESGCPVPPPRSKANPQALEKLSAKRVSKACFYGMEDRDPLRAELRSRAGRPLDLSDVQEDVRTLMASGRFDDVEVSAVSEGTDALVLFQLRERPRIAEVTFEGASMLQKEGLEPKISPEKNKPIAIANVYDAVAIIRDEYRRRGYRRVAVDVVTERSNPNHVRLKVVVAEGPQFKFGRTALTGAGKPREADLRRATPLEGSPFDEEKVLKAVRDIEDYYLDHGFPNAQVAPSVGEPGHDGSTPIGFEIVEGDLVRFGKVAISGVTGTNTKAPAVNLKSKQGTPYSRAAVEEDVRSVVAAFGARGEKVVVVPRRELDPKKHTIDVVFQVAPAAS